VTLTLNRPWSNISTAHRLIILEICAKLFVNPTRGSKDIKRTPNTVIQCLILDCDLDLEPTLVKHRHCTSSHQTCHLCKVICNSHQGFKRYRADTKAWRTDRQTDEQTDNKAKNNMSPHFMGGDIIIWGSLQKTSWQTLIEHHRNDSWLTLYQTSNRSGGSVVRAFTSWTRSWVRSRPRHTKNVIKMEPDASLLSAQHIRIGLVSLISNLVKKGDGFHPEWAVGITYITLFRNRP